MHDKMRIHTAELRQKSLCTRIKMGAVIYNEKDIIGEGINWGSREACLNDGITNDPIEHAEVSAIKTIKDKLKNSTLMVSHYPCIDCATRIVDEGFISKVYCKRPFKNDDGIKYLRNNDIEVIIDEIHINDIKLSDNYLIVEKFDSNKKGDITTNLLNMQPTEYCRVLKSGNKDYEVDDIIIIDMMSSQYMTINNEQIVLIIHPKHILLKKESNEN